MKEISFSFDNSKVSSSAFKRYEDKLLGEIRNMKKVLNSGYVDERCSINLCDDSTILKSSKKVFSKIRDVKTLVVIGIGGSNLGALAVYDCLKGKLHNEIEERQVYFADTVDTESILNIVKIMKRKFRLGEKVVLNVVSKSGGTTETIANFRVLIDVLRKNQLGYRDYVVATTDEGSKLDNYAKEEGFHVLHIPQMVGGRYSVFSNVGVFPLTFLGVDVSKILKGAKNMRKICLNSSYDKNPAMQSAVSIFEHSKKGRNIFNTFLFATSLESLGKWYRQLLAESCGKEFSSVGKKVNKGVTPITSVGSVDLHSMAQLYLGGPNDKFHCFVDVKKVKEDVKILKDKDLSKIVKGIEGKKLTDIMSAILKGVKLAFEKKEIPFCEISLAKVNEYSVGAFLQMKMMEVMMLGVLLGVSPFDQPSVEEYKAYTRDLLGE